MKDKFDRWSLGGVDNYQTRMALYEVIETHEKSLTSRMEGRKISRYRKIDNFHNNTDFSFLTIMMMNLTIQNWRQTNNKTTIYKKKEIGRGSAANDDNKSLPSV